MNNFDTSGFGGGGAVLQSICFGRSHIWNGRYMGRMKILEIRCRSRHRETHRKAERHWPQYLFATFAKFRSPIFIVILVLYRTCTPIPCTLQTLESAICTEHSSLRSEPLATDSQMFKFKQNSAEPFLTFTSRTN